MPCCAFAAFILGQILIAFDGVKRFALGRESTISDNAATEWRLLDNRSSTTSTRRGVAGSWNLRWIAVAASLEVALAVGGIYGYRAHLLHHHAGHHQSTQPTTLQYPKQ